LGGILGAAAVGLSKLVGGSDPRENLRQLVERLRHAGLSPARIGVTLSAMIGIVALVFITTDAWKLFGDTDFTHIGVLASVISGTALAVLLVRLRKINDEVTMGTDAARPKLRERPAPSASLATLDAHTREVFTKLETRGLRPSASPLGGAQRSRLRAVFDETQILQVLLAIVVLGGVLVAFSMIIVNGNNVNGGDLLSRLDPSSASGGSFPVLGQQLADRLVKVVAVMCSLAGVFFAVVTLGDDQTRARLVDSERTRLLDTLALRRMHKVAAYAQANPTPSE